MFSCKAKASADYECGVFLQDTEDQNNQQYGVVTIPFTTEWTDVTAEFIPNGAGYNKFTLNYGDFKGTVILDRISIVEKGKTDELVKNGDFLKGDPSNWMNWGGPAVLGEDGYFEVPAEPTVQIVAVPSDLVLTFDESGNCTVSSKTEGVTATGTGKYVKDGEKKAWANKDRDAIYLDYQVDFGSKQYAIKDTLVARSREITVEQFSPTLKK